MWCAHTFCHMSVGRVGQEELPLCIQGSTNVLLAIDVFLTAVHHTDVACKTTTPKIMSIQKEVCACIVCCVDMIVTSTQWQ